MSKYVPKNKELDITLPFRITWIDYDMWAGIRFTNTKGQSIVAEPDFCTFKKDEHGKYIENEKGRYVVDRYVVKEFCEKDSPETQKYFDTICNTEQFIPNEKYDETKDYLDDDWEEEYVLNPEHKYNYNEPDNVGKAYNFKFGDFVKYVPMRELEEVGEENV